ncbi:MAG: hypothetical protein E4H08_00230 [Candidatus Atribacteria bacterium]|nr:MAG: hypothetical protein E4H08_00230 [Candidatus Atribacteria bacterium]
MRIAVCAFAMLLLFSGFQVVSAPDMTDGISVLLILSSPYGANTALWYNQFERLGWTITLAGTQEEITYCTSLCTAIEVDTTLDVIPDLSGYDAVVVSTMPRTGRDVPFPAQDLRESPVVLELIRQADAAGLTLFTGCSGLLVFGNAGVLEGHTVDSHFDLMAECATFGATCIEGGQSQIPITDGNLVTGTSGRYFAQENPEIISRSLDANVTFDRSLDSIIVQDVGFERAAVDLGGPTLSGWAIGGRESEGAMGMCGVEDGFVIVGYTFSSAQAASDLLAVRFDANVDTLWAKSIGGPGREYGHDVCVTDDGGLAIVGYTTSAGSGMEDVLLLKLTSNGEMEWLRTYGDEAPDAGYGITTTDGGLALCGYAILQPDAPSDGIVIHTDAEGFELWRTLLTGDALERAHAIVENEDGTLIVVGGTTSSGAGNYDVLLAALSPSGDILMQKVDGFAKFDVALDVIVSSSGDYVVVG